MELITVLMSNRVTNSAALASAKKIFATARPEYRELIREFLKEERNVMHLKRRSDIHQRLFDHIKRVIK